MSVTGDNYLGATGPKCDKCGAEKFGEPACLSPTGKFRWRCKCPPAQPPAPTPCLECERLRGEVERLIQERLGLCLFRSKVAGLVLDELDPAMYSETEILAGIGGLIAKATQPVLPPGHLLVRIEDWEKRK